MNLNATLFAQLAVFLVLAFFTMKFVWPPLMKALDERAERIANGLAAADRGKADLAAAEKRVQAELATARDEGQARIADAEKRAAMIIDDAKKTAAEEAARIVAKLHDPPGADRAAQQFVIEGARTRHVVAAQGHIADHDAFSSAAPAAGQSPTRLALTLRLMR